MRHRKHILSKCQEKRFSQLQKELAKTFFLNLPKCGECPVKNTCKYYRDVRIQLEDLVLKLGGDIQGGSYIEVRNSIKSNANKKIFDKEFRKIENKRCRLDMSEIANIIEVCDKKYDFDNPETMFLLKSLVKNTILTNSILKLENNPTMTLEGRKGRQIVNPAVKLFNDLNGRNLEILDYLSKHCLLDKELEKRNSISLTDIFEKLKDGNKVTKNVSQEVEEVEEEQEEEPDDKRKKLLEGFKTLE